MKLLAIFSDTRSISLLRLRVQQIGCSLAVASSGAEAADRLAAERFDAIVIDLDAAHVGEPVLHMLRPFLATTPSVVLAGVESLACVADAIAGGVTDFATKPIDMGALLLRIRVAVANAGMWPAPILTVGPLAIDLIRDRVHADGVAIELPDRERRVLIVLALEEHVPLSAQDIRDRIADLDDDLSTGAVHTYISRLRARLKPHHLEIRRNGDGYRLQPLPCSSPQSTT